MNEGLRPAHDAVSGSPTELDVAVIGGGFAGLYALYKLRDMGLKVRVYEAGSGVGGTWFWNRYPGARCDVESIDYSYSFSDELQQEWSWSERYAAQPEILSYLNHVADRFDLRPDIQLDTRITTATFDGDVNSWLLVTQQDERIRARFCVMATGCLSAARLPDFPGLGSFEGEWYQTADWPHEGVNFTDKRVGIIGTGSSGVQAIPIIAEQADHLHVFQRTANFSVPARNRPVPTDEENAWKAHYAEHRRLARLTPSGMLRDPNPLGALEVTDQERRQQFEARWQRGGPSFVAAFADLLRNEEANEKASEFVRDKIAEVVKDPEVAQMLMPNDHPLGTKRLCADTNYYETYNRDNVTLVNVRQSPIVEITPRGLSTTDAEYDLDVLIFAIGFDAMTGALLRIDIKGRDGLELSEKWAEGARTYLGLAISGFPNMFIVGSVGSPSVLANMPTAIEQHVEWIARCIERMGERGRTFVDATAAAEDSWVEAVNEAANETLYPKASSWYVGANVPGKPRVFLPYVGGFGHYESLCNAVEARDYEGFEFA